MQKGLALLNSLPTTESSHILNAWDLPCFNGHQTYLNSQKGHKIPLKCVIGMSKFSTSKGYHATNEMLEIDEKTENYGWQILTEYEKYAKDVNVLFVSSPLFSSLHPHYQKNHEFIKKSFLKKIKGWIE